MDTKDFLTRVVAPGGFYAFAYRDMITGAMMHRFFKQSDLDEAVKWIIPISLKTDVWHAVASYKTGSRRRTTNTENLRCFWYDADIKRVGDGKADDKIFKDPLAVASWLKQAKAQGLPYPNLWINSGYGIHLYWVFEQELPTDQWLPHALAFKARLVSVGAVGDIGVTSDAARILRPVGTFNLKVPGQPMPCLDMTPAKLAGVIYPDAASILPTILQPAGNIGGPSGLAGKNNKSIAAAKSGLARQPHDFDLMASRCAQVGKSLAEEGEHDGRQLWHLMVNLTYFCEQKENAHRIGRKHKTYTPADTDAKWDQTDSEHQGKSFGAPSCTSFDAERPGICASCPYKSQVKTPYSLGIDSTITTGLPRHYRQTPLGIEQYTEDGWALAFEGQIAVPEARLTYSAKGDELSFDYTHGGLTHQILARSDLGTSVPEIRKNYGAQGVLLNRFNASKFGDFIMAWMEELVRACKYSIAPQPFGWVENHGRYEGLFVAGTYYDTKGKETPNRTGDAHIHKVYQPKGDIAKWRQATEFITGNKPEMEIMVAAAFAAPLMEFVGESGVMSVWSRNSGARKTSAFRAGTAVWCNPRTGMSALKDTPNSVQKVLAETQCMPVYWDEVNTTQAEYVRVFIEMIFNITQGRGRARLDSNLVQRDPGNWRTMLMISGNRPILELVEQDRAGTNAGTVRVFEYQIEPPPGGVADASNIVQLTEQNYGQAGRIYARWLATHVDDVKKYIDRARTRTVNALGNSAEERFHYASIIGLVTGAFIANKIGLIKFNVPVMFKYLIDCCVAQRVQRQDASPIQDDKYLAKNFNRFCADMTGDLLVVQSFPKRGVKKPLGSGSIYVKQPPITCDRALVYISLDEKELRFEANAFNKWCTTNRLSAQTLVDLMKQYWHYTKMPQGLLAAGTNYATSGQVVCHKLENLDQIADLAHHLEWGVPSTPPSNVVAIGKP